MSSSGGVAIVPQNMRAYCLPAAGDPAERYVSTRLDILTVRGAV